MAGKNPLSSLLGRSPIGPIQEHMQVVNASAQLLRDLFTAASAENWQSVKEIDREIIAAKANADKLRQSIRKHLQKSLFLPVPRTDLLELVARQDKIATAARNISATVVWRSMRFPDKMHGGIDDLVNASTATSQQALTAIQELDELLEVGFTGIEVKRVEAMLKELKKLERRTLRLSQSLHGAMLPLEAELSPIDVMFYYRTLTRLEKLADCARAVGDRLQILMAR